MGVCGCVGTCGLFLLACDVQALRVRACAARTRSFSSCLRCSMYIYMGLGIEESCGILGCARARECVEENEHGSVWKRMRTVVYGRA